MYLLTNLIQDAVALLGNSAYWRSVATGGSATTVVDTTLLERSQEEMEGGTVIIVRDSAGANADPEGKFGKVSAYDDSSYTMTIPTVTTAVASGDEYMFISPQYPLLELRRLANLALQRVGVFNRWDTTLTTAADQTEYTLPTGLKFNKDNMKVWIQNDNDDSNDNQWSRVIDFRVIPSDIGDDATLVLPQYEADYTIALEYESVHPIVYAYNDEIDEVINPVLIQLMMAAEIFAWVGITDDNRDQANKVLADLKEAKMTYKIPRNTPQNKFLTWSK